MSIGQRIAQKRKEMGLSQEALGEQMGVSRQAIYKWESDAALPEIEKLVALAKLFAVSVGWLLGVEDETGPEQAGQDAMSQAQLDMVEQIVRRYIEAQPEPRPRRRWPWVAAACVLLAVVIQLFIRMDQLSSQYNSLQNSVSNISSSVSSQIGGIAGRVEAILKAQNQLTAEYNTQVIGTDYRSGTVTISMKAVPKTYTQNMSAVFLVDHGDGPKEFEAALSDGNAFTCEAEVTLTDSIAVSVVFVEPDGTRKTQVLDTYSWMLSASYPQLDLTDYDLIWADVSGGKLTLESWYVTAWKGAAWKGDAQITEFRVGIFRNRKLIGWGEACEKPGHFLGDFTDGQFFKMPELKLEDLKEGETVEVAALVTDSYGRQFIAFDIPYEVSTGSDGEMELTLISSVTEYSWDLSDWTLE